jgi:DNA-binding transcriptional regulator LsrR (DeoR family)
MVSMAGFDVHAFAAAYAALEQAAFPGLSPVQQLVLRRLFWLTRGQGIEARQLSQEQLAHECGLTRLSVARAVRELEALGHVKVTPGAVSREAATYAVVIPKDVPLPRAWVAGEEGPAIVERLEAGDRALFESLYAKMPRADIIALREEVLAELRGRGSSVTADAVERAMKERAVRRLLGPMRLEKYEAGAEGP